MDDAAVTVETTTDWRELWRARGQYWRTEPLISEERQDEFRRRMAIVADIAAGMYPFRDAKGERIRLQRADVEWLLAEHGPISWEDQPSRWRAGVDLRGADLSESDLSRLPMARCILGLSFDERTAISNLALPRDEKERMRERATCCLEQANLFRTHLEGAELGGAYLKRVMNSRGLSDSMPLCLPWPTRPDSASPPVASIPGMSASGSSGN